MKGKPITHSKYLDYSWSVQCNHDLNLSYFEKASRVKERTTNSGNNLGVCSATTT